MARTRRVGLDYFPMDIDMFQDLRIRKLIRHQGGRAVTVYLILLCTIYKHGYYMRWDDELPFVLAESTGFTEDYIQEVIRCCLVLGLFDANLFNRDKVLTSCAIQKRYSLICELSRRAYEISDYNLIPAQKRPILAQEYPINAQECSINVQEYPINAQKKGINVAIMPQRKGKEITTTPTAPAPVRGETIAEEVRKLGDMTVWVQTVAMRFHISVEEVKEYLGLFQIDCLSRGTAGHESIKDAQCHFNDWLRITLKQQKKENGKDKRRSNQGVSHAEEFSSAF